MFDTNIFGKILKMQDSQKMLKPPNEFFVTHIQVDELNASPQNIKTKLLYVFQIIPQENIPTESAVVGVSRIGGAKISDSTVYHSILVKLDKAKPLQHENNIKDALIGETAIKNTFVLVTNDKVLLSSIQPLGGKAMSFDSFQNACC
jgi:predicted nucleic acid-binding protein